MKTVSTLPIDQIQAGMHLADDVRDAGGHVLVPRGTEISESLLASLQRREIPELSVEFVVTENPAAREARRQLLSAQLDQRFRLAGDTPEIALVRQAILDFNMENGA